MARIQWVGIIDSTETYQKAENTADAIKLDMPPSAGAMMIRALPFLLPALAVIISSVLLKAYFDEPPIYLPFMFIGIAIGLLLLPIHELLHAIVFPRGAVVSIGFYPKALAFMALCSFPVSRKRFVVMSLLPYILGLIPLVAFIVLPAAYTIACSIAFGAEMIGLVTPYTDAYNVYKVLRDVPRGARVFFDGDDTFYIPKDKIENN